MKKSLLVLALFVSFSCLASVTVSGISSGAYMAQQFHTAYSSEVSGSGLIAGGPYFCAKGKMIDALNKCMQVHMGLPTAANSLSAADKEARAGNIDPVHHLAQSRVYILGGTNDKTVVPKVVQVLIENYRQWKLPSENIKTEVSMNVGHAFPTDQFGNDCTAASQSPFISDCGRDIAGEMLGHLLGELEKRTIAKKERLFSFNQLDGVTADLDRLSMNRTGYAYIPSGCENPDRAGCRIHVAFHGCKQTTEDIQNLFMTKTGYNEWAESNRIVIFYPQAVKNMLVNNPNGCWDWWGYTNGGYHTKKGIQMERVYQLVRQLAAGKLSLKEASFN